MTQIQQVVAQYHQKRSSVTFMGTYGEFKKFYEETYAYLTKYYATATGGFLAALKDDHPPQPTSGFYLYLEGRRLCPLILAEKEVPSAKLKTFDKTLKLFDPGGRRPKNFALWFVKNLKSLEFLLESDRWPSFGITESRNFTVGSLNVINQTTQPPDAIIKLLTTSNSLIQRSKIPKAAQILYGDVFIVGNILRKNTVMAQYFPSKDNIQILMVPRFSEKFLHSLIHEFGHRYWRQHMADRRTSWISHHHSIGRGPQSPPKVGDTLLGVKGSNVVQQYQFHKGKIYYLLGDGKSVASDIYAKYLKTFQFPTPYASKDAEEHFCEVFSLYCLGDLKEPHKSNFEALILT